MDEFKGKRWNIKNEHHVGNGMVITSGGGKTKEFIEWEENQIPMTWEDELQKMELEKEYAKGEYLDMVAEQQERMVEDERYMIKTIHRLDCVFLKNYGMTMDDTREFFKDNPDWVEWFSKNIDLKFSHRIVMFTDNDIKSLLNDAPDKKDVRNKEYYKERDRCFTYTHMAGR
jgi:hypothetical protein